MQKMRNELEKRMEDMDKQEKEKMREIE